MTLLDEHVANLGAMSSRRMLSDREHQRTLAALQEQLVWTRAQAEARVLRPLVTQLLLVVDRLDHQADDCGDMFASSIRDEILNCLLTQGITRIPRAEGAFDPSFQEAVGVTAGADAATEVRAVAVVRHGYRHDSGLLRAQAVHVHGRTAP